VNAIVLSGGSAFGLDAASGVQAALREAGIGFHVRGNHIPIVPGAILFDLANGGDKDWGRYPPYRELGYEAAQIASQDFAIGTVGAGTGALTAGLKGGLGSASTLLDSGIHVGALAAVNSTGSVTVGRGKHFWAAPFEIGDEFGNHGYPSPIHAEARRILLKFRDKSVGANTTIAIIATDAVLTAAAAKRLAIASHDGFTRAIWPTHTPADGDLVFALATGASGRELSGDEAIDLYATAGATMARAIARGVYTATPSENDLFPVWSSRLG
jgi:L-aminopeptidase/D-esterase-like protein